MPVLVIDSQAFRGKVVGGATHSPSTQAINQVTSSLPSLRLENWSLIQR